MASEQPASGPRWWFVYYRVRTGDLSLAVAAARSAQQALCASRPGLEAALMQRPASSGVEVTLLETYRVAADSPADIQSRLPAAIEATMAPAVQPWLSGPRRLEAFTPCA
ncbi:MAG: DUF4936 family protein [Pseudomonadota bacterium]